jgi:hypothetical protein
MRFLCLEWSRVHVSRYGDLKVNDLDPNFPVHVLITITCRLDRASVLILEHLKTMEAKILEQLDNTLTSRVVAAPTETPEHVATMSRNTRDSTWMNGDVVMTWNALYDPIVKCGLQQVWGAYRKALHDHDDGETSLAPGLSPSIQAELSMEFPRSESNMLTPRTIPVEAPSPFDPIHVTKLLESYVVNIHSKSPILDLDTLRNLRDQLLALGINHSGTIAEGLPPGFGVSDMVISLLVLSLGEIATQKQPDAASLMQSRYIDIAYPWLGVMKFGTENAVKELQAQVLLTNYCMWALKPWEAWCHIDAAACAAEKLLLRSVGVCAP